MVELNELPEIDVGDISDDDFILIFDGGAATLPSKKARRDNFLNGVARADGDHNFGTVEITNLTATTATIIELKVGTGTTLQQIYAATGSLTVPELTAGVGATLTLAAPGVVATDQAQASFTTSLADGLTYQCWVSAPDVVSIRVFNGTTGTITTITRTAIVSVTRFDFS
tara:strand:+ start:39930 stop:40439 length:510 start_codon:yes stop_codon:yes gene_type:complete